MFTLSTPQPTVTPMRYDPTAQPARTIEELAAESRQALEARMQETRISPLMVSRQAFYADACKTWAICRDIALCNNDRSTVAQMEYNLDRDMAVAINHRPWQPEY